MTTPATLIVDDKRDDSMTRSHPSITAASAAMRYAALWLAVGSVHLALSSGALPPPLVQHVHDHWDRTGGLPQNSVWALAQTADGYVWTGTEEGLVRFDGVRFTVYNTATTPRLPSNGVSSLLADQRGRLWIGTTGGGLVRASEGEFAVVGTADGLPNLVIQSLCEDEAGALWVGTSGGGLSRYAAGVFTTYTTKDGLVNNVVTAIARDGAGALWIGTHAGLSRWWEARFTTYTTADGLPSNDVRAVYASRDGTVWIGTTLGLARARDGRITSYAAADRAKPHSVRSLVEDRAGTLWCGTQEGGLIRLIDDRATGFDLPGGAKPQDIRALLADAEGCLWLGTNADGLHRLKQSRILTFGVAEGLSHEIALGTLEDEEGTLWVATYGGGLNRWKDGSWSSYRTNSGLSSDIVLSLARARGGGLWIGTRGGLDLLRDERIQPHGKTAGLAAEPVLAVLEDSRGEIWVGTRTGVKRLGSGRVRAYDSGQGLRSEVALAICERRDGSLWVGTEGGGLHRFEHERFVGVPTNPAEHGEIVTSISEDADDTLWLATNRGVERLHHGRMTRHPVIAGLEGTAVYRILDDESGGLWLSSARGIFRVSKRDFAPPGAGLDTPIPARAFAEADGMRSAEANGGIQPAGWRARDGRLWFPTIRGVVMVDPPRVAREEAKFPMVVEEVFFDRERMPLHRALVGQPGVRTLEFRYSAPTFLSPQTVQFRHRLDGYDPDWIEAGTRRAAFYTNIRPGDYTFRVMARMGDGRWIEPGAAVALRLKPYFTQTRTFYALVVATGGLFILMLHRGHVSGLKRREQNLARIVSERTRELNSANAELAQASRLKDEFLANVSHELRTPLTAILGLSEALLKDPGGTLTPRQFKAVTTISTSGQHLLALINDILDLSKIEAGKLELKLVDVNVPEFCETCLVFVRTQAMLKQIGVAFESDGVADHLQADPKRLKQILVNLLSNAVKFTPRGGRIGLSVSAPDGEAVVRFSVWDTGIGVAPTDRKKLFRSFSQIDSGLAREQEGTGLGLALVAKLVELHGGNVELESEPGKGSRFTVTLPRNSASKPAESAAEPAAPPIVAPPPLSRTILLAEDNAANTETIGGYLEDHGYAMSYAANGLVAVKLAREQRPALILMDVQMPVMDGLAAMRELRTDPALRTTPIIALTALAMPGDRERCLAAGANDYLAKPVSLKALAEVVARLLAGGTGDERTGAERPETTGDESPETRDKSPETKDQRLETSGR